MRSILLSVALSIIVLGCGGGQLRIDPISRSANPSQEVNDLDRTVSEARKNDVNVLSPSWFEKAEQTLKISKEALRKNRSPGYVLRYVAKGKAELKRALTNARIAQRSLTEVVKARSDARQAGATKLEKEYDFAEAKFLALTKGIERGNAKWAQRKESDVVDLYRHLELRAIKQETLGEVGKLIQRAEAEGAEEVVPQSLRTAKLKLEGADSFISKYRYKKKERREKAEEALFYANRLVHLNRAIKKISTMKSEEVLMWVESMLEKIAKEIQAPDMRNQDFGTQVDNIIASIAALKKDHQFAFEKATNQQEELMKLQKQIADLEGRSREERAAKQRLEADRRFDQLFTKVRRMFKSEEADIYKQGDQLLIRLKVVRFPVGRHVIMPTNYALLSKVQRAIHTFEDPTVVIEGHTDSTGSDAVNDHLSQKRAEAVREYLIHNKTLAKNKLVAVGYGSKRPLASNATRQGRAINRRIDVIIQPRRPKL